MNYTDGERQEARVTTADRIKYDFERSRRKWPNAAEAPFLALAYWAYAALIRTKQTELDFDDWCETVEDTERLDNSDDSPES
ncbi:hypothetical protein ACL1C4_07685 [Corynebacterium striatum]|uniref:hypothetical protein n=1 Tax=Corynebacterium striatum TaxID=43770 RepID=UPI00191EF260|nr:hypothetical protein [Corynebacterium striatum]EGT5591771.1 hypothetical protein [Corynebacterium striatum]QQU79114.1 hypothetical protein I6I73_10235 [Corynebacterium striatum]